MRKPLNNDYQTKPYFHRGVRVRVRDESEIMAVLDETGCTDGLTFMPEMRQYCGGIYKVDCCVNRVLIESIGIRGLRDVLILEGVRCNGTAHGACNRFCSVLWKSAWVEMISEPEICALTNRPELDSENRANSLNPNCQGMAVVLLKATVPLRFFDLRQYLEDHRSRTRSNLQTLGMLFFMFQKRIHWDFLKIYRNLFRKNSAANKKPSFPLKAGDLVEVRSKKEIRLTLNRKNRLAGMLFAEAMWQYCGKRYRVAKVVESMIDEATGVHKRLRDTYLLEDVTCDGLAFRGCPRRCFWFWKGAWLKPLKF